VRFYIPGFRFWIGGQRIVLRATIGFCLIALQPLSAEDGDWTARRVAMRWLEHVRFLASDDLDGRAVGERGNDRAAAYIAEAFRSFGVRPAGEGNTFFQTFNVPLYLKEARRGRDRPRSEASPDDEPIDLRVHARNVIGVIPGTGTLANQYAVVGAHYDGGKPGLREAWYRLKGDPNSTTVLPGADDNASGTAALIELARYFARFNAEAGPRRGLLLIAFSAEELWLLGSAHFVNRPTVPLDSIVAMVNLDMIGRMENASVNVYGYLSAREFRQVLTDAGRAADLDVIEGATSRAGPTISTQPGDAPRLKLLLRSGVSASDHIPFYRKGIPFLFFYTSFHDDRHTSADTVERLNAAGAASVVDIVRHVVERLLRSQARPTYVPIPGTH